MVLAMPFPDPPGTIPRGGVSKITDSWKSKRFFFLVKTHS